MTTAADRMRSCDMNTSADNEVAMSLVDIAYFLREIAAQLADLNAQIAGVSSKGVAGGEKL